jgi:galactose mutarotase-like enzyme
MLSEDFKKAWPYEFGLVYSVTLSKDGLATSLNVTNEGKQNFDFQVLMHTYLKIAVRITYVFLVWSASNLNRTSPTSV